MTGKPSYPISRLDYDLPPALIAQQPLAGRVDSRMLYIPTKFSGHVDTTFDSLPDRLPDNCLIVMNNSQVIPARLFGTRLTGGRVEILFHRWLADGVAEAVVGSRGSLKTGESLALPDNWHCELLEPKALDGIRVRFSKADNSHPTLEGLLAYLQQHGSVPLPPYIKRGAESSTELESRTDSDRYQTVYASQAGSVAAPTAGLHFDQQMLAQLKYDGHTLAEVTLHVGLGTFAPVRADDLAEHQMHGEIYSVSQFMVDQYLNAMSNGQPVLAIGTTSLRVLQTLWEQRGNPQLAGETSSFIYPGQDTKAAQLLLTNYHLPRSTLLALVYSFGGETTMRKAYEHAVSEQYRFFSYGDCMLIDPKGLCPR